jgi:hypothetical protein
LKSEPGSGSIIRLLMRIDANVQALLDALTEEDDEDEEPES